jgi:hypothetical protein
MENSRDVCSACNARIEPGSKFCTECGKPVEKYQLECGDDVESANEKVEDSVTLQSTVKCPQCNTELSSEDKFCIECGALIETSTNCPQCNAPLEPGARFCTECGTVIEATDEEASPTTVKTGNVHTTIPSTSNSSTTTSRTREDPMDDLRETGKDLMQDVEKTGKGLMKDLGSFLGKSSKTDSRKKIKPAKKDQHFLVCNKCGGYYELKEGESPDDFDLECDCGGHLEHQDHV